MDLNEIQERLLSGRAVTDQERAFVVRNNPAALAAFMIDNNPGNVRHTLAHIVQPPYTHLDFTPNKEQLRRQLQIILQRGDTETLETLLDNFILITDNLSPSYVTALRAQLGA